MNLKSFNEIQERLNILRW